MPLTDVQWVLGHAQLTTTQLYLTPPREDVIATCCLFTRMALADAVRTRHRRRGGGIGRSRWRCCSGRPVRAATERRVASGCRTCGSIGSDRRQSVPARRPGRCTDHGRPDASSRARFPARPAADRLAATGCRENRAGSGWRRHVRGRRPAAAPGNRRRGVRMRGGLAADQPGDTWQQRWLASGAEDARQPTGAQLSAGAGAPPPALARSTRRSSAPGRGAVADLRRRDPPGPGLAAAARHARAGSARRWPPPATRTGSPGCRRSARHDPAGNPRPPGSPLHRIAAHPGRQGRHGRRHHRRRLPGAAATPRHQPIERRASTSCCTHWACSRGPRRPRCGRSVRTAGQLARLRS